MAASNYARSLALVLLHEGGYVNHSADPGGATMRGVTQAVYDAYRRGKGLMHQPVKRIAEAELQAIYRRQYWDLVHGDQLWPGLDYAVFDIAVNSGVGRAVKILQQSLGVKVDGAIGLVTLQAARGVNDRAGLIRKIHARRLGFLHRLTKLWKVFGRGWLKRVKQAEISALQMNEAA